ncbi:MAG TPA: DMT family transporter [Ktedonobacterales bacterium]
MPSSDAAARRRLLGVALVLLSAVAFGSTSIFADLAFRDGADEFTVLLIRFGIAAAVLLAVMAVRRMPLPPWRIVVGLILLGVLGRAGQGITYFSALELAPAGLVALLLYLYPALVTLLAVVFLKERLTRGKILALLVALAGTALAAGPVAGGEPLGVLLSLATAAIYAVYIVASSRVTWQASAFVSSALIVAGTVLPYAGIEAVRGTIGRTPYVPTLPRTALGWGAILAMALFSTVVGTVTFFAGLQRVGPTNTSILSTFEPIWTVLLAALVLGERLSAVQLAGGVLILAAVLALASSKA